jgi:pimeloyl-ACP methyl ester carboxylesterase
MKSIAMTARNGVCHWLLQAIVMVLIPCVTNAATPYGARTEACDWSADVPATVVEARLVIFGEVHGTKEIPALVGEFVCWWSGRRQNVILALEMPRAEQHAIDTYLSSAGALLDQKRLTSGVFWNTIRDGRSSEAMARLIERIRRLRASHGGVGIVAIDSGRYDASRDAAMATNLQGSMRMHPRSKFVVLVGNMHAARDNDSAADQKSESIARHLAPESPITINAQYLQGTTWSCVPGPPGCGVNKVSGWRKADTATGFHMGVAALPGFDGSFALGAITASLPAAETPLSETLIAPEPRAGFHFPYILRVPPHFDTSKKTYLLVEPNNSGHTSANLEDHISAANDLSEKGAGSAVSRALDIPLLMPVFPRPPALYTHSLSRPTLLATDPALQRLDLQLVAMIKDARRRLGEIGMQTHDRVFLIGFSASGHFVNRFTALHPESVEAVVAGAVNGILILPFERIGVTDLPYPLGVMDIVALTGRPFQLEAWKHVPQFIFMGAEDTNDWAESDDAYTDAERRVIFAQLGERMLPDRWQRCQDLYRQAGAKATFKTYAGVGHWTNGKIHADISQFLRQASEISR